MQRPPFNSMTGALEGGTSALQGGRHADGGVRRERLRRLRRSNTIKGKVYNLMDGDFALPAKWEVRVDEN